MREAVRRNFLWVVFAGAMLATTACSTETNPSTRGERIVNSPVRKTLGKVVLFAHKDEMLQLGEFYRDVIGLDLKGKLDLYWTEFDVGGVQLCLHHFDGAAQRDVETNKFPDNEEYKLTGVFLFITKEEAIAEYDRITALNVLEKTEGSVKRTKNTISVLYKDTVVCERVFYITDPLGNLVQFESK